MAQKLILIVVLANLLQQMVHVLKLNKIRSETLETLHKVFGHCNVNDVKKLERVVRSMKISDFFEFQCETCIPAKQLNTKNKRLMFLLRLS